MDVTARHFWDGCERGELSYQKCVRCAALHAPYGTVLRKAAPDCPRPPVARTFDWTSIVIAVVRQALNCLKFLKALVVPQACGSVPEE